MALLVMRTCSLEQELSLELSNPDSCIAIARDIERTMIRRYSFASPGIAPEIQVFWFTNEIRILRFSALVHKRFRKLVNLILNFMGIEKHFVISIKLPYSSRLLSLELETIRGRIRIAGLTQWNFCRK
jgi:hypothetical protein